MTTRSLSIVRVLISSPLDGGTGDLSDLSLLYYEDPTGRISVLSQRPVGNTTEWVNLTSQESKSLPDEFRNTPASTAGGHSKTLYESLGTDTTLRAPFTCGANWTTSFVGNVSIGAIFYSPQVSSPNASNFQFVIEDYIIGPEDSPGNFSNDVPGLNNDNINNNSTKPPTPHSCLQINICYSFSSHLKPKTGPGFQLHHPVRYSSVRRGKCSLDQRYTTDNPRSILWCSAAKQHFSILSAC